MAATNYTPIQLYYSTTASAAPTAGNLTSGELAINITDGKLYYKDNGGVVQVIATKGAGTIGGSTTQIQYNNAGALAGNAAMTFNSGTSTTTLTTLNLTNALGAIYGGTAQSAYTQGDFLYASATNTLSKLGIGTVNYILTSSGSVPQWSAPSSIIVQTATNLAGGLAGSVPYQSAVDTTTFLAIGAANRVMTSSGSAPQWVTALSGLTGVSSSSITNTSLTSGRVVLSSTAGLQADSASLTFNGTTLSAGGFSTTGLSTLVQTVKIGDSNFSGTAVFAPATPAKLYIGTGTVTDTTSAIGATNGTGAVSSLAITPIAASNTSVTYTNASTLYIAGAPSAGTNVTITNPYSLYIAAGASYLGGNLTLNGGTANGVAYLNGSKVLTTGSALTFDGTNLGVGGAAIYRIHGINNADAFGIVGMFENVSTGASAQSAARVKAGTNTLTLGMNGSGVSGASAYIGADQATPLLFYTGNSYQHWQINGSEQMRLTSTGLEVKQSQLIGYSSYAGIGTNGLAVAGNVGIGTSSPTQKLTISGSGAQRIDVIDTGGATARFSTEGGAAYLGTTTSHPLILFTAGSVKATLDTSGNLGLGVTPSAWGGFYKAFQLTNSGRSLAATGAGAGDLTLAFNAIYDSTDSRWEYAATGDAAVRYSQTGAGIHAWYTASSGTAGNPIDFKQAMTLDASGNLLVGRTSSVRGGLDVFYSDKDGINSASAQAAGNVRSLITGWNSATISTSGNLAFNVTTNGNVTNTNNSYGQISDVKLKENIVDAKPKLDKLMQVRIVNYNLKADLGYESYKQIGVIAQELEQVFSSLVYEHPDRDQDGKDLGTTTKSVKMSVFVPILIKAIQEQQAIIESLTARISALESN